MGGPEPIKLQEILAYFAITDIRELHERRRYLEVIQALDGVYLQHVAEQAEIQRKRSAS